MVPVGPVFFFSSSWKHLPQFLCDSVGQTETLHNSFSYRKKLVYHKQNSSLLVADLVLNMEIISLLFQWKTSKRYIQFMVRSWLNTLNSKNCSVISELINTAAAWECLRCNYLLNSTENLTRSLCTQYRVVKGIKYEKKNRLGRKGKVEASYPSHAGTTFFHLGDTDIRVQVEWKPMC